MAPPATHRVEPQLACPPTLFLAFAFGGHTGKRGCTTGAAQRPRERQGPAGDGQRGLEELPPAKHRFGWPAEARVGSGDEAGRAGCWLRRF